MNSFNRLLVFGLVLATAAIAACDEDTLPPPPDPPPQINVNLRYTLSPGLPEDTTSGLQSDDAFDILLDAQARTWVATQAGVSRFIGSSGDGTFNQNNVLPNPKCRALLEHNDKLWVGTWGGGVATYDMTGDVWSTLDVDSGLVNDMVGDIDAVGDSIFFATNDGASIYLDIDTLAMVDRWYAYPAGRDEDGILTPVVSAVEIAHTQTRGMEIWFAPRMQSLITPGEEGDYGMSVFRQGLFETIYYTTVNSALAEPNVNDLYYDPDTDLMWVAFATEGVATVDVDGKTWTYYRMSNGLPSNVVYSVTKVGDVIWVGTQGGLARMKSDGQWQGYGRSGGLPADRVRRVYSSGPSELWACFVEAGAARLDPNSAE